MSWNHRIIFHPHSFVHEGEVIDASYLAIHEVFYDEHGTPVSATIAPVEFQCDAAEGKEGLIALLERALTVIRSSEVLDVSVFNT